MLRDRLFESVIVLSGRLVDKNVGFGDLGVSSNLPSAFITSWHGGILELDPMATILPLSIPMDPLYQLPEKTLIISNPIYTKLREKHIT